MEQAAKELLKTANERAVTLVPISMLDDWEGLRAALKQDGVEPIKLPGEPIEAGKAVREGRSKAEGKIQVLEDLRSWKDPNSQAHFLRELLALTTEPERESQRFVVQVGSDIVQPDVLPALRLDDFGLFVLPPSPLDTAWREMGNGFDPQDGLMETLHAETGGNRQLAQEILAHAGKPASWQTVNQALRDLQGADSESLLGRFLTYIYERPELVEAVWQRFANVPLTNLDEFRLLAVGVAHSRERELSFASPVIQRFVESFFAADTLAELYAKRGEPQLEQRYWERFRDTPQFASLRPSRKAEINRNLAKLADENGDELTFYRYSQHYLGHVGPAERCLYLESVFVPRATKIVQSKGYPEYRAALDRFIDGLATITGQPRLRLYTRDPTTPETLACHVWRPATEEAKGQVIRLDNPTSLVSRLISGTEDEIDEPNVYQDETYNTDFARQRKIQGLLLWPLISDGRRIGAVVLDDPQSQDHPLPGPVRAIARRFLKETEIAVERAALVASEVELLSKFHLLLEAARTDRPSDLVRLAQRIIHASIREIRVSSVRLFEGHEQRRMRLVSVWPEEDEDLKRLREEFGVISPESSALEVSPKRIAGVLYKPDLSSLPSESPTRKLMEARDLRWVMVYDLGEDGGSRIGRLTFYGREEWEPQPQEIELLEGVKQQITLALKNMNEAESNARRQRLLTELYHGLTTLAETRPSDETLQSFLHAILQACCDTFEADVAHCLRLPAEARSWVQLGEIRIGEDEEDLHLDLLASGGPLAPTIMERRTQVRIGEGISGLAVAEALQKRDFDLQVFSDITQAPQFIDYVPGIKSAIAIVLRRRTGRVLGVFTIESKELDHFDDRAIELARDVARELASAIEFVDLFDALARRTLVEEMGAVSADLAHWLGNVLPLTRNRVERAGEVLNDPGLVSPSSKRLEIARAGLDEAVQLLDLAIQMREDLQLPYLRQPREKVDLARVVEEGVRSLPEQAVNSCIEVNVTGQVPRILGLRTALVRLLHALLRNAQDAVSQVPEPRIVVTLSQAEGTEVLVHLRVEDNGPGLEPAKFRKYLGPFKSTKSPTQGTGLGLWTTQKVVDAHKGVLKFTTAPGQGMTVDIWLPLGS